MPIRKKRNDHSTAAPSNAIVAAATRLNRASYGSKAVAKEEWQDEAWRQFRISPELGYAVDYLASSLSRCRLTVNEVALNGVVGAEVEDPRILGLLSGLIGNPVLTAEILKDFAVQLTVPGDCWMIGEPGSDGSSFDHWCVASITEFSTVGTDKVQVDRGHGDRTTYDLAQSLVFRVHVPDPERHNLAYSQVRRVLTVLREIEELSKYTFAVIDSRLAGAGILFMPSEMTFPLPKVDLNPGESAFMGTLAEAMLTPIADRGNPSSVVPIVVQAPAESIAAAKWLTSPNHELTTIISDMKLAAISRLATGLNIPAEIILGSGAANRYNVWQMEEQAIKLLIEPLMMAICSALVTGYLIPVLDEAGLDATKYTLWFDSSELVLRPDRSADAKDAYDRGELSGAALRRELGFTEDDAPTGEEKAQRAALKLITLAPTVADVIIGDLIKLLGLDGYIDPEKAEQAGGTDGTPPQDNPGTVPAPRQNPEKPVTPTKPAPKNPGPAKPAA